ncbi:hypothetical protein ACKWTF_013394 [Chironomus riparius]
MLAIMCNRSRDPSPVGSEISVGSPSPPPSECERRNNYKIGSDEYFQPLKRLKMVNDHTNDVDNNNHCSSDASRTSSLKSPSSTVTPQVTQTTTTGVEGVKSFSIADILGRDSTNKNNSTTAQAQAAVTAATIVNGLNHLHHHQQVARIVRPWDHLQHPISIRPLLPPALLHYEQRLAMEYHQQLQEHFHAQAQLLRHMNIDIIPSESGSDRSSSVASGDCCSPDIGRSSDNSGRSHPSQQHPSSNNNNNNVNRNGNKSPNGSAPLDALFQLSNKNFDEANEEERVNLFAAQPQPKKKRKSRTAFTNHQIFELEKRFLYQKYLSPADRDEIAGGLGLSNAQVITWFQNRRAKLKRDMEELKKDVESVKILTTQKSFLENVNDMNLLKSKATNSHNHHHDGNVDKYRSLGETEVNH